MEKLNLNTIPELVAKGIITRKEAVDKISEFVSLNYSVFGLQKYDEDFRSEIILAILERKDNFIDSFDSSKGNFFTYIYYKIKNLIIIKERIAAKRNLENYVILSESKNITEEKEYNYKTAYNNAINLPKTISIPAVPYAYKPEVTSEELKKTFENVHGDKKLLVVAIKSAYYITDKQIKKICNYYGIDENSFFKIIQYCRNELLPRAARKQKLQESRNFAYINHINLEKQLDSIEKNNLIAEDIKTKNERYYKHWESLNKQLEQGLLSLRPTNKTVASLLGLCERQVAYYVECIKNKKEQDYQEIAGDEN